MTIKDDYFVQAATKDDYEMWLTKKHYAHRIPPITESFGLYDRRRKLRGVCTFGPPARMLNDGYGCFGGKIQVQTSELNRLVVDVSLPKNALSYFVASCLKSLERPHCIVSYADSNSGHHGYIYQATNWHYTGMTAVAQIYKDTRTGKVVHARTIVSEYGSREADSLPEWIQRSKETSGKYRYFMFLGDKNQRKEMAACLEYPILPYPKGNNQRYDASYEPITQDLLF